MSVGTGRKISLISCLEQEVVADPPEAADVLAATHEKFSEQKPSSRSGSKRLPNQTVILFDWDDTLFPTSDAMGRTARRSSACPRDSTMEKTVHRVKELLEMALQKGHTFIVTNAEDGWVEEAATNWAPELLPILGRIPILSARSKFEACCPDNPSQWKILAFLAIRRKLGSIPITNLISVGDSDFEMEAVKVMAAECQNLGQEALVKTVRFKQRPTLSEHSSQIEAISGRFERIVTAGRNLEVSLAKRKPHKASLSAL